MNTLVRAVRNIELPEWILKTGNFLHKKLGKIMLFSLFVSLLTCLVLYKVLLISSNATISSFWTFYGIVVSLFLISRIPYAYLYSDEHTTTYAATKYPTVSVIIAAKNEEAGIFRTIETCVNSDYPSKIECIVIDDGSTDKTLAEMERAREKYKEKINVVSFPVNQGKKEAMAAGVKLANNEIFIFVDSDSYLAPDAMKHAAEHFMENEKVGAVSGNTKVENKDENLLTRMQSIQYAISFDIYKACESVHESVTCCPGCFSAYRREAIKPLIEHWKDQTFFGIKSTFGDDRSLTNFVLRSKWDVVYCEKARATTLAPTTLGMYWKQQLRWKKSWVREGVLGGLFMWKRKSILASLSFYIHFTFPFLGPILAINVLVYSIATNNIQVFLLFITGFVLMGFIFSVFVRLYRKADNFLIMPLFSVFFVTILIWQMPYAMLTIKKTHWGTR